MVKEDEPEIDLLKQEIQNEDKQKSEEDDMVNSLGEPSVDDEQTER